MNISNAELKNSMGTIRTDFPINNHVGLIKSASTSTCCANENLSQFQRKSLHHNKYLIKDDFHHNKRFVVEPSSYLEKSLNEKSLKTSQNKQLRYDNVKHFSDCDIDKEVFNSQEKFSLYFSAKENEIIKKEFHSHSGLDKILVNEENNNSVINFAVANDLKANSHQRMDDTVESRKNNNEKDTNFNSVIKNNSQGVSDGKDSSQSKDSLCGKLSFLNISDEKCRDKHSENSLSKKRDTIVDSVVKQESPPKVEVGLDENSHDESEPESCSKEKTSHDETIKENKSEKCKTFHIELSPEPEVERKEINANKPFRRSSSLKIHKESTSTPAQKKIVRFADVLGLDLIDVRTFLDELPSVPKSAYDDLKGEETVLSESPPKLFIGPPPISESKSLVPTFKPPVSLPDFLERIRDNYICLETASVFNSPMCHITGTVRVRNLDFYKSVYVRYTLDNWKTFSEVQASYVPDSCDGFSDKFTFVIYIYTVIIGQRIELAVRYHCCGSIYWDNNNGNNYVFQCFPATPSMPSYFHCISPSGDHCNSFY